MAVRLIAGAHVEDQRAVDDLSHVISGSTARKAAQRALVGSRRR